MVAKKVPSAKEPAVKSADKAAVRFKAPATKAVKPVTRATSFAAPKTMTNVQQFRNDSTAKLNTPITRQSKSYLADLDSRNAVIDARNKKDREFRGYQARQEVSSRKSRGY